MGSKKKKNNLVSAYGITMTPTEKTNIDNYNTGEKTRGDKLDANYTAQKEAVVKKEGTVDYKKFLKSRLADLTNILGVKK